MITIILSIVLALSFLAYSFALGKRFLSLFSFPLSSKELFLFSTVLGVSFFGFFFFFLGIFHLYFFWFFLLFFIVLFFIFYNDLLSFFSILFSIVKELFPSKNQSFIIKFCFFTLSLLIIANFFFSLTPEIQWDSLVYHLTQAKLYAAHNGIVELPYDYHTYMPRQFDILFVLGEIFQLPQTAKIFTFLFNLFLILGIFIFLQRYFSYNIAILTSVLFYTIPTIAIYQSTTYADLPATLFLFYSCYSFILSFHNKKFLVLTGIFLGAAAATKILLLSLPIFFIFYLFFAEVVSKKIRILTLFFDSIKLCLLVLFFLSPWLILTYTQVNNPLYPFFYSTLGGDHWNSELEHYWSSLRADYGSGQSVLSFFLTPWYITMNPILYGPVYGITPLFLVFIPLIFLFFFWASSSFFSTLQKKICLFFLFFSLFYFVVWFFLASDIRYLFPLFPALTLLSVLVIHYLLQSPYNLTCRLLPYILTLLLITNLLSFFVVHRNTVQFLFHIQDTPSYIHSYVQNYPMALWVNANLPDTVLLFIANDDRVYFYDRQYIQGYPIIQGVLDYQSIDSASQLHSLLLEKGITHVVLTRHHLENGNTTYTTFENYYNEHITRLWLDLVADYGSPVTVQDDVYLYSLN